MHVLRRLLPVLFVFFLKKNYFNGNLIYVLSSFFLNTMFCLPKNSFRTTLPLFCFITMEEQVSGMMNLSGRRMWYTQVLGSRQNGINSFSYTSLSFPPSYMSFLTLIYIYIFIFFMYIYMLWIYKVVCKEILAPWHCSAIRLYIHLGWKSWSRSLWRRKVSFFYTHFHYLLS